MATLAIKGHATRGKEVIEILEMLGGNNIDNFNGNDQSWGYYIKSNGDIDWCYDDFIGNYTYYSLEEFLEKFPYKVGDKVKLGYYPCTITEMSWEYDDIIYYVQGADFSKGVYSKDKDLQPYKEETQRISIIMKALLFILLGIICLPFDLSWVIIMWVYEPIHLAITGEYFRKKETGLPSDFIYKLLKKLHLTKQQHLRE